MAFLRSAFIGMSKNRAMRGFSERSALGRRMSSRFVAGMTVENVLQAAEALNEHGISATLDSLGESVSTADAARRSADIYHQLLDAIKARKLNSNVSVKLTQMGLEVDAALAFDIVRELVVHALKTDNFVRIDMEGTEHTDVTLDIVRRLHETEGAAGHVGVVVQAYLYRTAADVEDLLARRIRLRLCKGAYQEPRSLAYPAKADVDANFVRLVEKLLPSGVYHGIATHDEAMIEATRSFARAQGIAPASFEFQMLYGVRRDLQRSLVAEGYGMRVYVPFGPEWYPYFMRRLAERPANVLFLARNFFRS